MWHELSSFLLAWAITALSLWVASHLFKGLRFGSTSSLVIAALLGKRQGFERPPEAPRVDRSRPDSRFDPRFDSQRPAPRAEPRFDEMLGEGGQPRAHWAPLDAMLTDEGLAWRGPGV